MSKKSNVSSISVPDVLIRTAYDGLQKHYSSITATDFTFDEDDGVDHPSRSRTVQADARDTDINFIMERYLKTGLLPQSRAQGFFGDASALPDYQEAQNIIVVAKTAFEALPAKVRERFHNSPEKFLDFMADEDNRAEAQALGLLKPVEPPLASQVPPSPDTPLEGAGD